MLAAEKTRAEQTLNRQITACENENTNVVSEARKLNMNVSGKRKVVIAI